MRKIPLAALIASLLVAAAAGAHSGFRQRVRYMEGGYQIWQYDDGGLVLTLSCGTPQQDQLDGGTWPLKHPNANVDGGTPNNVFNSCARAIERQNGLDGGFQ